MIKSIFTVLFGVGFAISVLHIQFLCEPGASLDEIMIKNHKEKVRLMPRNHCILKVKPKEDGTK